MAINKLVSALNKVSKFVKSLNCVNENSSEIEYDLFFSMAGEGTLMLNGNEAIDYRDCLNELIAAVGSEIISPNAIEKLYQRTILIALDIEEKRQDIPFERRIQTAIEELQTSLSEVPSKL